MPVRRRGRRSHCLAFTLSCVNQSARAVTRVAPTEPIHARPRNKITICKQRVVSTSATTRAVRERPRAIDLSPSIARARALSVESGRPLDRTECKSKERTATQRARAMVARESFICRVASSPLKMQMSRTKRALTANLPRELKLRCVILSIRLITSKKEACKSNSHSITGLESLLPLFKLEKERKNAGRLLEILGSLLDGLRTIGFPAGARVVALAHRVRRPRNISPKL